MLFPIIFVIAAPSLNVAQDLGIAVAGQLGPRHTHLQTVLQALEAAFQQLKAAASSDHAIANPVKVTRHRSQFTVDKPLFELAKHRVRGVFERGH